MLDCAGRLFGPWRVEMTEIANPLSIDSGLSKEEGRLPAVLLELGHAHRDVCEEGPHFSSARATH